MAIYNEILAARFARGIQKIFAMKGDMPTKQLAGEVMPVILANDLLSLEHRILLNVRSFTRSFAVAAGGAGNRSAFRLRNPVGSNVVAVLEKCMFFSSIGSPAADSPFVNRGPTGTGDLLTIDSGNVSIRDLRMGAVNSSLILSTAVNAGALVGVQQLQMTYSTTGFCDGIILPSQEIVIAPGDVLTFYSDVLNQALTGNLMWRERALEESELFP